MALSATKQRLTNGPSGVSALILEAATTYQGSFMKLNGFTHGTSSHQGRVEVLDSDAGSIPYGIADKAGTGTSGALVGDESENIRQDVRLGSYKLQKIAVTGASTFWFSDKAAKL